MNQDTHRYDDIIELPHHVSATHPHMSMEQRAAQFAPFAALAGHTEAIQDAADFAATHNGDEVADESEFEAC